MTVNKIPGNQTVEAVESKLEKKGKSRHPLGDRIKDKGESITFPRLKTEKIGPLNTSSIKGMLFYVWASRRLFSCNLYLFF